MEMANVADVVGQSVCIQVSKRGLILALYFKSLIISFLCLYSSVCIGSDQSTLVWFSGWNEDHQQDAEYRLSRFAGSLMSDTEQVQLGQTGITIDLSGRISAGRIQQTCYAVLLGAKDRVDEIGDALYPDWPTWLLTMRREGFARSLEMYRKDFNAYDGPRAQRELTFDNFQDYRTIYSLDDADSVLLLILVEEDLNVSLLARQLAFIEEAEAAPPLAPVCSDLMRLLRVVAGLREEVSLSALEDAEAFAEEGKPQWAMPFFHDRLSLYWRDAEMVPVHQRRERHLYHARKALALYGDYINVNKLGLQTRVFHSGDYDGDDWERWRSSLRQTLDE